MFLFSDIRSSRVSVYGKIDNSIIMEAPATFSEGTTKSFQRKIELPENLLKNLHLSPSK
jgi:hypothetical protein